MEAVREAVRELPSAIPAGAGEGGAQVKTKLCTECGEKPQHSQGRCQMCYMRDYRGRGKRNPVPEMDMSGARCRCGLRLPCNDCLPVHLDQFMTERMQKPETA